MACDFLYYIARESNPKCFPDSLGAVASLVIAKLGGNKVHRSVKFTFMASEREGTASVVPNFAPAGRKELSRGERSEPRME